MPSHYIYAFPVVALALLAGCESASPPSYQELDSAVATMARGNIDRTPGAENMPRPAVRIEQGYSQALRSAVLESQSFAASIRRYREAEAGVRVSQSDARPQVSAGATLGVVSSRNEPGLTAGALGNITLSQLIYDGGATRANVAGASAQAYAARANVSVAANEVGRDAAMAWIDLWQANAHLSLLRDRLNEVSPLVERIERLISNGIVDRAALAGAQRQLLDLRLEQERLDASLQDAMGRFNHYFGVRPNSVPAPQRLFGDSELAQMQNNWQDSPSLIGAAAELIVAERAVDAARARTRPTIRLGAGVSSPSSRDDRLDTNVGVMLQYNFGDGGRRAAELERLDERLQAGRAAFEDTLSSTSVSVQTALARHRSLRGTVTVLEAQITALNTERNTLRSQITSGQANLRQLVESEVLYYRALARLAEVRGELARLEITLASQTGHLVEKLNIDLDSLL